MNDFITNLLIAFSVYFMVFGTLTPRNVKIPNIFAWLIRPE